MMTAPAGTYVPLWVKSNFSFLNGASHPDELVDTTQKLGLGALALTDENGVYGLVRAHVAAKRAGIRVLAGAEVTIADGNRIVLIAENRDGYANLCTLLTSIGRSPRAGKGDRTVTWDEVLARAPGLIALWPGNQPHAQAPLGDLRDAFGDGLYAVIARHLLASDPDTEDRVRSAAAALAIPTVAATEVLYHHRARRDLQDVVTCIRHGVQLSAAGRRIRANAEHDLLAPAKMAARYADDPHSLARTMEIAGRCRFSLAELRYRYPSERLPDGTTSMEHLRQLTIAGAQKRYPGGIPAAVTAQIERELALIGQLDYPGYFLTMFEIAAYCRRQNILCQGRGSAANSAVCYCLGITAVDPVEMHLLFERFLSRERAEPPDIDLDIEHERREQVIQHVYSKYGRDHAAMVANVVRYRSRSALREVGKVLGISPLALDGAARLQSSYNEVKAEISASAPATVAHLNRLASELCDFPRHLSIHPGGFLLGHEPVSTLVPIEDATMPERTVIQWTKDDIDDLGLFKVDLLGLGALTHLHLCIDLIRDHRGENIDLAALPQDDAATYQMIQGADTVGVFQIESRAQMSMLPRLLPARFYDLVVEVALVRPGPITGDMVHPYLRRRAGTEAVEYPHEKLRPILERTLGVPLFQEQVMRIAMVAADYSPGEADELRRDMAAWRPRTRMEAHHDRLISRMQKNGISAEFAERIFNQIRGFGEYGFPESHAASFALIAYATAYLKCHYPVEFTCALLNAQPMGFYSPATIVEDGKRHGVTVRPISIQESAWDCTLEEGAIRMGLRYVKGLSEKVGRDIAAKQPFSSLADFSARAGAGPREMKALAEAGALEPLSAHRRDALWSGLSLVRSAADSARLDPIDDGASFVPLSEFETIAWDLQASQHSTRGHILAPLRATLASQHLPTAREINAMADGRRTRYVGVVICRQRPATASGVMFATLEDETGLVNLVIWQQVLDRYPAIARTTPVLGVSGKIQAGDGVTHIVADKLWEPRLSATAIGSQSRDFR
ncbi:MAG TPA: error-prone DNA polymerase [Kofleriaceae bacterium]|nr:error-prone DNA polymerase [Kofleriaceae bacterium]